MSKYKVGIYGIGNVAIEYIKAFNNNPLTRIAVAVTRNKEKTEKKLKSFGFNDIEVINDYDELVKRKDIDIICITGPHFLHAKETIKAVNEDKHVMVEKPLGMTFKEVLEVYKAVKKSGVKTQQGTPILYNPFVLNVLKLVDSGHLGKIFYIEADNSHNFAADWGGWKWGHHTKKGGPSAVLSTGIHAIAFLRRCAGEVEEVFGYQTWGWKKEYEYGPTFTAVLKFKDGAIGNTYSTYENVSPYTRNFIIHGTKGSIMNDKYYIKDLFPGQMGWQKFNTKMPDSGAVSHHAFGDLVNDFIDSIENNKQSAVNIEESLKIHEICYAITKSIETGKIVKLPFMDY